MAPQSRLMSLVEAVTNVAVGFLLALLTQFAIFPMFGLLVSVADNLVISSIFTAVSLLRSFTLRRLFEANRMRRRNIVSSRRTAKFCAIRLSPQLINLEADTYASGGR